VQQLACLKRSSSEEIPLQEKHIARSNHDRQHAHSQDSPVDRKVSSEPVERAIEHSVEARERIPALQDSSLQTHTHTLRMQLPSSLLSIGKSVPSAIAATSAIPVAPPSSSSTPSTEYAQPLHPAYPPDQYESNGCASTARTFTWAHHPGDVLWGALSCLLPAACIALCHEYYWLPVLLMLHSMLLR
jgi:hypothetical protein